MELENADESSRVSQLDAQIDVMNEQIGSSKNTNLIYDAQRNEENAGSFRLPTGTYANVRYLQNRNQNCSMMDFPPKKGNHFTLQAAV